MMNMLTKEYVIDNKKTIVKIGYNIFPEIMGEIKQDFSNSLLLFVISKNLFQYVEKHIHLSSKLKYILIDDGEESKSFYKLEELCEQILSHDVDRNSIIVTIGGGTVSDLAGIAASIIFRGLRLIHIPTTLIAQADSAVGGKNAINSMYGKNLIGTFHLAERTYCDIKFLQYLPQLDYSAGYAEVLKYGLICDKSFYDYLHEHQENFIQRNADYLLEIVERSIDYKAKIVASDFFDTGKRKILNFGHTFAHAIEKISGYKILHGQAVAIGLCLEAEFSRIYGGADISSKEISKLRHHLNNVGLQTEIFSHITMTNLVELMRKDKKNIDKQISLVMLKSIGNAYFCDKIDYSTLEHFIERIC